MNIAARMDAFVTLVFGYSVVALIYQNKATVGINAFFGKATLGLIQAFTFNWLYFDVDGCDLFQHAIRRHVASCAFQRPSPSPQLRCKMLTRLLQPLSGSRFIYLSS